MFEIIIGALIMLFGIVFGFALAVSISNSRRDNDDG